MARSRYRSRRMMVLSFLAAVIGIATLAGVVGAVRGDPAVRVSTTTTQPPTTTTGVPAATLGKIGGELDDLVAAGRRTSYHAIYTVTDPELPEGLVQTVELWREDGNFRFDTIERVPNGTKRIIAIANGDSLRSCELIDGTQTCKVTNVPPADLPGAFVSAIVDASPKPVLTSRTDDIIGFQARCFEAEGTGELCLTTDGVMLRLVLQGAVVEVTRLENEVPESTFDVAG